VNYYSFELSISTIVCSLLVTNMLSLWMVVFIWFDVKTCTIISEKVASLARARRLTPATYVTAHDKFVHQIDRISSVLDIVVVVAYINTITYFIILLIIPSYISLSYLATFGRETIILFMVLPDIATVNDMHTELVRVIVDKTRYCSYSLDHDHGEYGIDEEGKGSGAALNFNITQSSDFTACSGSVNEDGIYRSGLEDGGVGNQYQLYMVVKEYTLQIPILMKSKVFTKSNIRNQLFGVLLAGIGLLIKVIVDNRYA
jgi:hypothetical protein